MNVLICHTVAPFTPSPLDALAEGLASALADAGATVDHARLPFAPTGDVAAQELALRLTSVGHAGGALVALDTRGALVDHPYKVVWWTRDEDDVADGVRRLALDEAAQVFASGAGAARLRAEFGVEATVLDPSTSWRDVAARLSEALQDPLPRG